LSCDGRAEAVLVAGLGNPLMGDDGFGAAVVEALGSRSLAAGVSLCTAPDVLHLSSSWRGEPRVWLVDVVVGGARPGTIHRFDHDAVLSLPAHPASAHHLALAESLRWLLHATPAMRAVRFRLWGAEPSRLAPGDRLSRPLVAAVASVVDEIVREADESTVCRASSAGRS